MFADGAGHGGADRHRGRVRAWRARCGSGGGACAGLRGRGSAARVLVCSWPVSVVALMAVPVHDGATALGGPLPRGPGARRWCRRFDPEWLRHVFRYAVGARGGGRAPHGDERPDARPGAARLLAGHQPPDPERGRAAAPRSSDAVRGDHDRRGARLRAARCRTTSNFLAGHLRLRRDARVHARAPVGDRAALPRAGPAERVPGPALVPVPRRRSCRCPPRSARCSPSARGSA